MVDNKHGLRARASRQLNGFAGKLAQLELGRFQAAVLAILFACVWSVIGLLTGYLLSYLVVRFTSSGIDASSPASIIFNLAVALCAGYGVIRGWRLYREFSASLGD
jgi:hypothetical protein